MDDEYFEKLKGAKSYKMKRIYMASDVNTQYETRIRQLFEMLYEKLLDVVKKGNRKCPIYKHHIDMINTRRHYYAADRYENENNPDDIVTDYFASMTDDYFIDLCAY